MMSKHSRRKKASKAVAPWHQQKRDDGAISSVILDGVPHVHHGDHVHIPDISLGARWEPAVNVKETAEKYIISAELPGVDKNDLKVSIRDGVLMLSGQRRGNSEARESGYLRQEQFYGEFQRSFDLPDNVKTKEVKASYKDGLLTVILPLSREIKKPDRKIAIS